MLRKIRRKNKDKAEFIPFRDKTFKNARKEAQELFTQIRKTKENTVIVNFQDTLFMSIEYAHEYVTLKNKTDKIIYEINMNYEVTRMFDMASRNLLKLL